MKALIVGHGSIGKQRARDLRTLGADVITADPVAPADEKDALAAIRKHGRGSLVLICSPSSEHQWQTIQAIDAGALAVLVEKPPAFCEGDWRLTVDLAAINGTRLAVAFNYRFHPRIARWRQTAADLGCLVLTSIDDTLLWPTFGPTSYVMDPRYGGVLMTSLIHAVDLAVHLLGPGHLVQSTLAQGAGILGGIPMAGLLEIQHEEARSVLSGQWFGPPSYSLIWATHKSDAKLVASEDLIKAAESVPAMHQEMMAAFVRYANGGDPGFLCTGEQALDVMRILDEARA